MSNEERGTGRSNDRAVYIISVAAELAGVKLIMELEAELERMRERAEQLEAELRRSRRGRPTPLGPSTASVDIVPLRSWMAFPWGRSAAR